MVQIAEEVWREWDSERLEEESAVMLRFVPAGDLGAAAQAIHECVRQVTDAFDARLQAADDPALPYVGEWSWLRAPDAVLVNAIKSDIVDQILPELVHALEQRGIEGIFHLPEPAAAVAPPSIAHHLECRIRVRGRRVRHAPQHYRWLPDRDAHAAILVAADDWCRRQPGPAMCSIDKDRFAPIAVSPGAVLADRIIDAAREDRAITATCEAGDEFRSITARSYAGRFSLIAGGPSIAEGAWRTALADFTGLLRELADHVVYAYVKRAGRQIRRS
jgi:hypothetical protein